MRLYYDTEFIEDGSTIDLVSIGIAAQDGREYYAVSSQFDLKRFAANDWLMANVWPSLPQVRGDARMMILSSMREGASAYRQVRRLFDAHGAEVKPRCVIAREVADFVLGADRESTRQLPYVEMWANYGAYDHVALCWLWGGMGALPEGMPMFTCDLQQEAARLGFKDADLPQQSDGRHNALADARHNRVIGEFLREREHVA